MTEFIWIKNVTFYQFNATFLKVLMSLKNRLTGPNLLNGSVSIGVFMPCMYLQHV